MNDNKRVFINLSNHNSEKWSVKQVVASRAFRDCNIIDVAFPTIDPSMDLVEVTSLAHDTAKSLCIEYSSDDLTVHIMGEMTFVYAFVEYMRNMHNIRCVASTTVRNVEELADGSKKVVFEFDSFRDYYHLENDGDVLDIANIIRKSGIKTVFMPSISLQVNVTLDDTNETHPITVTSSPDTCHIARFSECKIPSSVRAGEEPAIVPTKGNRSWKQFAAENGISLVPSKFNKGDLVVVRWSCRDYWIVTRLVEVVEGSVEPYRCVDGNYLYCLPLEGNEYLIGTTNNPN